MPILFDDERRTWALRSSGATYGLTVDEEGCLRHLYFGPPLPRLEDLGRTDEISSPPGRVHFFPGSLPQVRTRDMSTQSGAACTTTSLASRQRLTRECAT